MNFIGLKLLNRTNQNISITLDHVPYCLLCIIYYEDYYAQKLQDFYGAPPCPDEAPIMSALVSLSSFQASPYYILMYFSIFFFSIYICSSIIFYYYWYIYTFIATETPSIRASITPPIIAFLKADCGPLLIYRTPPVTNPEQMAFQGSSC